MIDSISPRTYLAPAVVAAHKFAIFGRDESQEEMLSEINKPKDTVVERTSEDQTDVILVRRYLISLVASPVACN